MKRTELASILSDLRFVKDEISKEKFDRRAADHFLSSAIGVLNVEYAKKMKLTELKKQLI